MDASLRISVALVAGALWVAGPAAASTIEVNDPCDGAKDCEPTLVFTAEPGEANDLTQSYASSGDLLIRDDGAVLHAGSGCARLSAHTARCPGQTNFAVGLGNGDDRAVLGYATVDLGPGDDQVETAGGFVSAGPGDDTLLGSGYVHWSGGPGDDHLSTGPDGGGDLAGDEGHDVIESGGLDDRIFGGGDSDEIHAGAGDDMIAGDNYYDETGLAPPDAIDGGPGVDTVGYTRRTVPVTVDLTAPGAAGAEGEGDSLTSIEGAAGGHAGDRLVGDDVANTLAGGPGDDVIEGGGGDDVIEGGNGFDRQDGGSGADDIYAVTAYRWLFVRDPSAPADDPRDRTREPIDCGGGDDAVYQLGDHLDASCERARFVAYTEYTGMPPYPVRIAARKAFFHLPCPRPLREHGRCRGRIGVSSRASRTRRRFDLPRGGRDVPVRLPERPGSTPPGDAVRLLVGVRYDRRFPDTNFRARASFVIDLPWPAQPAAR